MLMSVKDSSRPDVFVLYHTPGYGRAGVGWTPVLASRDLPDLLWWKAQLEAIENLLGYGACLDTIFRIPFDRVVTSRRTWLCTPGGVAVLEEADGEVSDVPRVWPPDREGGVPALQANT